MKSIPVPPLPQADDRRLFPRGLGAGAAWRGFLGLGVLGCCLTAACAPTRDSNRKFDIEAGDDDLSAEQGGAGDMDEEDVGSEDDLADDDGTKTDPGDENPGDETPDDDVTDKTPGDDPQSDDVSDDTSTDEVSDDTSTDEVSDDTLTDDTSTDDEPTDDTSTDEVSDDTSTDEVSDDTSTDEVTDDGDPGLTSVIADFVWVTGGEGTGPGLFDDARFVAADADGNAYVAEFETEGATRVQVFDTEGEFATQWFTQSESIVEGVAATLDGRLYVLQGGSVDHYEGATGDYLGRVSFAGSADAIAAAPDGGIVIVSNERILRLSSAGNILYDNDSINSVIDTIFISGASVDGAGNVVVIETFEPAVFKFNASGTFVDRLGIEGEGPGFLDGAPDSITTDGRGRIYAADWDGIEVFETGGGYAGLIDLSGAIFGMAATIDNELFVLERNYAKLYKLKLRE